MKILLFGANGQVGWLLQRSLQPLGDVIVYDSKKANFNELDNLSVIFQNLVPDFIVNAAAYKAAERTESEQEKANSVNADAVRHIAEIAKKN
jgi:dTDP-4-dehydrorhamnose reductase